MTKQEKLAVKSSLLSIKDSLFRDAWEDIVSDHPYVEQDDDDIEDDVLVIADAPEKPSWKIGEEKIQRRRNGFSFNDMESAIDELVRLWGVESFTQPLMSYTLGEEEGMGLYFKSKDTFVRSSDASLGIVNTNDEDEQAYLLHIGYKRFSDIIINDN
jgi:hypothetical protein